MEAENHGRLADLDRDGFAIVPAVVPSAEIAALLAELNAALATDADPVRSAGGNVYAGAQSARPLARRHGPWRATAVARNDGHDSGPGLRACAGAVLR